MALFIRPTLRWLSQIKAIAEEAYKITYHPPKMQYCVSSTDSLTTIQN